MRNRVVAGILALGLAVVLSLPPPRVSAFEPQQPGRLERIGGIEVAYVQGDPYQMGLQQGALWRSELRSLIRDYLYGRLIIDYHVSHFWSLLQARLLEPEIPDSLRQEMQGIADAAGLSYWDVLLLNTLPDLQALTRKSPSWELIPGLFSGSDQGLPATRPSLCAAFAGWGRATTEGELLVGHNLEHLDSELLRPYVSLIVRQPVKGNSSVSLGLMGMVGIWTGMNEEKLVVALSSSPSADVAMSGQLPPFLLRQALEKSGSLGEAVSVLLSAERLCGGNLILGDGKAPQAAALELSAHRFALFEAGAASDLVLRTNHFENTDLLLTQQQVVSAEELTASRARRERLQGVLESNHGWIGTDKALALLRGADGVPESGAEARGTLQSVLLDPARLILWIAPQDFKSVTAAPYVQLVFASQLLGGQ